ncbi:ARMT1-like domain-containing protein [Desulfovibrio aminophilus]|nr:ARMT1-like domain-containing protein [Desulfovibrio aminophilus]
MTNLSDSGSILDIKYGQDPALDGLLLHFMTENNLEYTIDPLKNASPEQIQFMVALREGTFYAPCSDWMFRKLLRSELSPQLRDEYILRWRLLVGLLNDFCPDRYLRRRIVTLCKHKFRMVLSTPIYIPSRLNKRMVTIFMSQSGLDDPYRERRKALNAKAAELAESPVFDRVLNICPEETLACRRISDLRRELDFLELQRLLVFATVPQSFERGSVADVEGRMAAEIAASQEAFEPLRRLLDEDPERKLRILYLPDRSGGLVFDLQVVKALIRHGHRVILALKEGFYYDTPTFWDVESDPVLAHLFNGAHFVFEDRMSKNELLRVMRENQFVVISDGSRERFNPYRLSVTFARAWKEADLILAKGERHYRRLVLTSHEFTRDVLSFFRDDRGHFHLYHKPRPSWVSKFGEDYITAKAETIISQMRGARAEGNAIMFYSGIVGSIPGQTKAAIQVMTTFVRYLRDRLEGVYIINPAEHFEEGMDADDLMFMWEKVQRSGLLNVWRFQSTHDIEKSFELMGQRVPPVWAGKDATYSTGCTKEMHIALDVQRQHPELQIIGPDPEKFFRRREYGVGKFCDVAIDECARG